MLLGRRSRIRSLVRLHAFRWPRHIRVLAGSSGRGLLEVSLLLTTSRRKVGTLLLLTLFLLALLQVPILLLLLLIIPLLLTARRRNIALFLLALLQIPILLLLLLIIALLFTTSRRRCLRALFVPTIGLAGFIAAHTLRAARLANHIANGTCLEFLAGRVLNPIYCGPAVGKDCLMAAADVSRRSAEIVNDTRTIDDVDIVADKHAAATAPEMIVEMVDIAEGKELRRENCPARPARSPADIIIAVTPVYPGRSPFRSGNPNPADARRVIPTAVMAGGPAPWLIAVPIPARVRPFPGADGVRLPVCRDIARMEASPVWAHIHPTAVRSKRLVKISGGIDLYAGQIGRNIDVDLRVSCSWDSYRQCGGSQKNNCQTEFHTSNLSFVFIVWIVAIEGAAHGSMPAVDISKPTFLAFMKSKNNVVFMTQTISTSKAKRAW